MAQPFTIFTSHSRTGSAGSSSDIPSSPVSETFSSFTNASSSSDIDSSAIFDQSNRHDRLGAWFLGPKAENIGLLKDLLNYVANQTERARLAYQPNDPSFISAETQKSAIFQKEIGGMEAALKEITDALAEHSIPFWSPRYNAHMNGDTSLPGLLGYLAAALFNPNNVTTESSPLTTVIERDVGLQLCQMLGYDITNSGSSRPWGHIVCGGSVANLESMWAARNLKFYPLSLACALEPGAPLDFIRDTFNIELCTGEVKLLSQASAWELMNLKPETVFDIPERLQNECGISSQAVSNALNGYLIQTIGKDTLEAKFGVKPSKYFVGTTKHYSWPKGAAITGIGSEHILDVPVDIDVRMDISKLDKMLQKCLDEQQSVYAVVAVMGSTEHGAVDPIKGVYELRNKYQPLGLSFAIHADAAWGGYYAAFLHEPEGDFDLPKTTSVPEQALSSYTRSQLEYLQYADSITIDPHKSGYIPYPAGGLCYRDGRMRYLVTWTNPNVYKDADGTESMGVYGVEGSKPGASAVGAWMSHRVIGLHKYGYGSLLGESLFSCTKIYTHWATMDMDDTSLIVVPVKPIPAERENLGPAAVRKQREYIRDHIADRPNDELIQDEEAMTLLHKMVSDLSINAFACNFRLANGEPNQDVVEANYLNTRIYDRLSVHKVTDNVHDKPLFIQSSMMDQKTYGVCADYLKSRLGVVGDKDLDILVNCVMSPFPTLTNFTRSVTDSFKQIAHEEIQTCLFRNTVTAAEFRFVVQGTDKLHLSLLPLFNMANYRHQLILSCDVPEGVMAVYRAARASNPSAVITLGTAGAIELESILSGSFAGVFHNELGQSLAGDFQVTNVKVVKNSPIDSKYLDNAYPDHMYFYLYGTKEQQHVEHMMVTAKNVQLTSDQVKLQLADGALSEEDLAKGVVVRMERLRERLILPILPPHTPSFFAAGSTHKISILRDSRGVGAHGPGLADGFSGATPIATGTMTLGDMVYADSVLLNSNPTPPGAPVATKTISKLTFKVPRTTTLKKLAEQDDRSPTTPVTCVELSTSSSRFGSSGLFIGLSIIIAFIFMLFWLCFCFGPLCPAHCSSWSNIITRVSANYSSISRGLLSPSWSYHEVS